MNVRITHTNALVFVACACWPLVSVVSFARWLPRYAFSGLGDKLLVLSSYRSEKKKPSNYQANIELLVGARRGSVQAAEAALAKGANPNAKEALV